MTTVHVPRAQLEGWLKCIELMHDSTSIFSFEDEIREIKEVLAQPVVNCWLTTEPVYIQLRSKAMGYDDGRMTEWGNPLDPALRHERWADGVEMRLLYTAPQTRTNPEQCMECGSNNVGVPATYDSLIDSVKTQQEPVAWHVYFGSDDEPNYACIGEKPIEQNAVIRPLSFGDIPTQPEQDPVAHTAIFYCQNCDYPNRQVTSITGAAHGIGSKT